MKRAKSSSVIVTGHRGAKGRRGLHHRQGLPPLYEDSGDRQNGTRLQMSHQPLMQKKIKNARQQRGECAAGNLYGYILHSFSFVTHSGATSVLRSRSAEVFLCAAGEKREKATLRKKTWRHCSETFYMANSLLLSPCLECFL